MARIEFGSLAWATKTRGELRGLDLLVQQWQLVRARLANRSRRGDALGLPGFGSAAEVDRALREVELPASPTVTASLALVTELGPPSLTAHVLRTYAYGTLLGLRDGLRWDRELFAVSALLHDVALARRRHDHCCFAHDGADQAREFLASQSDWPEARRDQVAEAICLHLRVSVPPSLGVEAHLVNAGAAVDVTGTRARQLSDEVRRAVLRRYPRGDLAETLIRVLNEELRRHPTARVSRWMRLGFGEFISSNDRRVSRLVGQ